MIKNISLITNLLIFSVFSNAQIVKIEGFAFSSNKKQKVSVQINDTINKLIVDDEIALLKNFSKKKFKKLITSTNKKGKFKIAASLKDSISFSAHFDKTEIYAVSDLLKENTLSIHLEKKICWNDCNENIELIITKGKKISFEKSKFDDCEYGSINSNWNALYYIDSLITGNYTKKNINFKVSVHARQPSVYKYDDVILYIYNKCNLNMMLRNGYDPIYKTKNNRWATPLSFYYWERIHEDLRPKLQKVNFKEPVIINFHESWSDEYISKRWYEPYYTVKGRKAIANYGFYIEDAIKIRRIYISQTDKSLKK